MSTTLDTPIPYATPSAERRGSPALAGAAVMLGGLGLVLLGGCFLSGVLIVTESSRERVAQGQVGGMGGGEILLLSVLYLMAFLCFAGAGTLVVISTRALLRAFKA